MNGDEYPGEIPGDRDIEAINSAIAWEEAGASEFIKSEIVPDTAGVKNRLTFRKIQSRPKPLTVVPQGVPKPGKNVWSGEMIVEGRLTLVIAYREV